MKHLSYELSLLAKEKGFNEPCMAYYEGNKDNVILTFNRIYNSDFTRFFNETHFRLCVPTYHQIVDWFREKYNINLFVNFEVKKSVYFKSSHLGCTIEYIDVDAEKYNEENYFISLKQLIEEAFKLI